MDFEKLSDKKYRSNLTDAQLAEQAEQQLALNVKSLNRQQIEQQIDEWFNTFRSLVQKGGKKKVTIIDRPFKKKYNPYP